MAENVANDNVYLICSGSYEEVSDITEHENFFVDEDKEENRLFSDNIEETTSPDLDEPNFNELKEQNSVSASILFDFVIVLDSFHTRPSQMTPQRFFKHNFA